MTKEFPKRYNPEEIEKKWSEHWESNRIFHAILNKNKKPYTIAIPPPNLTGVLTLGHVLNNTLQDILIRYHKLRGFETLWIPGVDHAGIATQVVVEQELIKEGITKEELGKEKFLERVWEWAEKHRKIIRKQLKRMGCALDWERERFTLDPHFSKAVKKVFVELYKKGLIYKGKYIVNWCPRCQTALSDEQVEHSQTKGFLYYLRYPFWDKKDYVVVATTRPETMLGDTAVAVNPYDRRYTHLIGKEILVPLVNRKVKIITDKRVDPEFGTGIVKITPAHDPQDFEIAKEKKLEFVQVMDTKGKMNENAGIYQGLDRFEARERIIKDLEKLNLFEKKEEYITSIGYCERCKTMIEPYLSLQWFVKMKPLAESAREAVAHGILKFYPERWKNLYFHWIDNLKDWCISRQLWWGHQIPVFYCEKCNNEFASEEETLKCPKCGSTNIRQSSDVLDTWFSSWLWPFVILGWPEKTQDYKYFYPTSTLVTGWDIIFLWVARMIMAGYEFTQNPPFYKVVFHPMIRDEKRRKMSKSLGNSPDVEKLIEKYGADALRFGLLLITPKEQDVLYSEERIKVGRNFCTKLWNAARFLALNRNKDSPTLPTELDPFDEWILQRLYFTQKELEKFIAEHDFNKAANLLYSFFWHEFCDWAVEIAKIKKQVQDKPLNVSLWVFRRILQLLHPFIPFITEELWDKMEFGKKSIILTPCPEPAKVKQKYSQKTEKIMEVIKKIRNIRGEMKIPQDKKISCKIALKDESDIDFFKTNEEFIKRLAKIDSISYGGEKTSGCATIVGNFGEIYLPLHDMLNLEKEKEKLAKEIKELKIQLAKTQERLRNPNFLSKASSEVIEKEKDKEKRFREKIEKIEKILKEN